jgi:hypothetical protein
MSLYTDLFADIGAPTIAATLGTEANITYTPQGGAAVTIDEVSFRYEKTNFLRDDDEQGISQRAVLTIYNDATKGVVLPKAGDQVVRSDDAWIVDDLTLGPTLHRIELVRRKRTEMHAKGMRREDRRTR